MRKPSAPRPARRPWFCCELLEDRTSPAVLSFGAAQDTEIAAFAPTTTGGSNTTLHVESIPNFTRQALVRFDNLFGAGPGQIPLGSTINAASLTLWVGTQALPPGFPLQIELHRMNMAWNPSTATWNTFGGNGVQANGGEALTVADGAVSNPTSTGYQIVSGLQGAVNAWAAGANNGWVLLANGTSQGWSMDSADSTAADRRPLLAVDFTPPNAALNPTYQQLAGNPPAVSDSAWFTWESNLQAQRLAHVPSARAATYYFAQSGNDATGTGGIDNPWKTVAKAQTVLNASAGDVRLRFKGGDTWREAAVLDVAKNNVTVDSYGIGSAFFTAFTTQYTTGWTRVSGDLWRRTESNPVGWVREGADTVYPFAHIYTRTNSSASVAATAYSFYQDASSAVLFLNAGPGVDPNALPGGFEAAAFGGGWRLTGDNARLENVRLHGYGMNPPRGGSNYGIYVGGPANAEAVLVNVDVFYTGYHAIGNAAPQPSFLTAVGCRAGLGTTDSFGNLTVFVGYSNTGGFEDVWADNEVGYGALPDFSWGAAPGGRSGLSFINHTSGPGAAGLIVALRTRYPDHPWQVAGGALVGGPAVGRVEDVRAFIVGEAPEAAGIVPDLGNTFGTLAIANSSYNLGAIASLPGTMAGVWIGLSRFWAYNCSFRVDASGLSNFGIGFAWFSGYESPVGPTVVNSRFDMVVPKLEFGSIVSVFNTPVADSITFQNNVFNFTGVGPAGRGNAALTGAKLDHNAYFTQTGSAADFTGADAAAVVLDRPPALGAPSLASPLRGAGAVNSLNYDQAGAARPAGPRDIGPLSARPLPTPAAVSAAWGGRTAGVSAGMVLSATGIDRLTLIFAANLDVFRDSLTVTGSPPGVNYTFSDFSYNPATHAATWTLADPVVVGRLRLTLDGNTILDFGVLPGDLTGDGIVNSADLASFRGLLGSTDVAGDINGDGIVNAADVGLFRTFFGATI